MIKTIEFENFGMIKKFTMTEGSEFKRFTLLGGDPTIIDIVCSYLYKLTGNIFVEIIPIENHIHYTEYRDRALLSFGQVTSQKQGFFTTQSYEMLKTIVEAVKDDKEAQDNFAYVRVSKDPRGEGHVLGIAYEYPLFQEAIEMGWEVR